ncbi:MAG: hypothetical protein WB689_29595 [Xanthobacteraceae bacterium]|jgi:hypothetical protein
MSNAKTPRPWMSVPEAGKEFFGITSKDRAYEAAHAGIIPFAYFGTRMRVFRTAAEKRAAEIAERSLTEKSLKVV